MITPEANLPHPDCRQAYDDVARKQQFLESLRSDCHKYGYDEYKTVLGHSIGHIYGNDPNTFCPVYIPGMIEVVRETTIRLLEIRINTPEIPEDIRKRLMDMHTHLETADLSSKERYKQEQEFYTKRLVNYTIHQIALHPEYREAIKYGDEVAKEIRIMKNVEGQAFWES